MEDTEVIDEQIDYELIDEENFENSLDDEEEDDVFKYKKERSTSTKETTIYIDPEELWDEVRKYYELAEANPNDYPSISNKLANALNDIATKIGYRPNFINYSYRVEMIGDAKLKLFKSIRDKSIKLFSTVKIENKKVDLCDEIIKDLKLKNSFELTYNLKIQLLTYISKINNLSNNTINVINRNMNMYQELSHTGFETMIA